MNATESIVSALVPSGRLRCVINLGNPILASWDVRNDEPKGVSVDLARLLAQRLGVPFDLIVVHAAGKSVATVAEGNADMGFFAIDPVRGQELAFTAPYLLIEGCYLVSEDSPIRDIGEVDHEGNVVVVGEGSAYDLFLTRELRYARIMRSPTSPSVVDAFLAQRADVAAGVKQQLQADAQRLGDLRLLDGRFMLIRQAMGISKRRGPEAAAFLANFVESVKSSGYVAQALTRHEIEGASVAPCD